MKRKALVNYLTGTEQSLVRITLRKVRPTFKILKASEKYRSEFYLLPLYKHVSEVIVFLNWSYKASRASQAGHGAALNDIPGGCSRGESSFLTVTVLHPSLPNPKRTCPLGSLFILWEPCETWWLMEMCVGGEQRSVA